MLIYVLIFLIAVLSHLVSFKINTTTSLHTLCEKFIHPDAEYKTLYQALICGSSWRLNQSAWDTRALGLYHLFVVSGSHLIFIKYYLEHLRLNKHFMFIMLFLFAAMNNFNAPVARALVALTVSSWLLKMNYSVFLKNLICNLIVLIIFPHWVCSFSLYLSSLCSLAIALGKNFISKNIFVFIFLAPVLIFANLNYSPLSIACNIIIAPFFEVIMFPASILVQIAPWLGGLVNSMWTLFFEILALISKTQPYEIHFKYIKLNYFFLWSYYLLIGTISHFIEVKKNQW